VKSERAASLPIWRQWLIRHHGLCLTLMSRLGLSHNLTKSCITFFYYRQLLLKPRLQQGERLFRPKDGRANLFLNVSGGDVHVHHHYNSQQANAIQNTARRYLGPIIPTNEMYHDQLLSLYQVIGDASAKAGDRGTIEAISPNSVKLIFASEEVKRQIVALAT
jgi:hypothetical protein